MKKSKIFLGVSALLLTVAGVYASKTSKINHRIAGYTITSDGGCKVVAGHLFTATRVHLAGQKTAITNGKTVFTNPNCSFTAFTLSDTHP